MARRARGPAFARPHAAPDRVLRWSWRSAWLVAAAATLVGGPGAWAPAPARAATEEFSTFDVERQEEDDESALDHLLTAPPLEWRDEWDRAARAFRTAQGCLTSGQWFMHHDLRLVTDLGVRARFGIHLDQTEDDVVQYQNLDLSAHFPTRFGTPGIMFRPLHDKSRQDFALMWEFGADTLPGWARVTWGFEDLFNNLWAFRQTRVGNLSEPYERHPWEPAVAAHLVRARWGGSLEGKYLTPSRQQVFAYAPSGAPLFSMRSLWGTWAAVSGERSMGSTLVGAAFDNRQASGAEQLLTGGPDAHHYRRQWHAELSAHTHWTGRLTTFVRAWYGARRAEYRPPVGNGDFSALDRIAQAEAAWTFSDRLTMRVGAMYDRVGAGRSGPVRWPTEPRVKESRAYLGLAARFGRVRVAGIEGIELDTEPYEVWHHHDKGFLQMQTTF
jgi:hypothetical protein